MLLGLSFVLQRPLRRPLAEGQVDRRRGLGVASRRLGVLLLPASQLVVPFLYAAYGSNGDLGVRLALPATFALATLGYGLQAWRTPLRICPHAAAWSAAIACLLGLWALRMPDRWWLAALAGLALVYTIIGRGLRRRPGYAWPACLSAQASF